LAAGLALATTDFQVESGKATVFARLSAARKRYGAAGNCLLVEVGFGSRFAVGLSQRRQQPNPIDRPSSNCGLFKLRKLGEKPSKDAANQTIGYLESSQILV